MKFYFIRHAPTTANLSGAMIAGYENSDINLYDKPEDWEEKVGKFIPEEDRKVIISSPTKRCISTAKLLFDRFPNEVTTSLGEFECKALGNRKFWEISEEEFNNLVYLPASTMEKRAKIVLHDSTSTDISLSPPTRVILFSCSARSTLACAESAMSPISSINSVPPLASSNLPLRCFIAEVNEPFS